MVTREGGADAQGDVGRSRWLLRGLLVVALATLAASLYNGFVAQKLVRVQKDDQAQPRVTFKVDATLHHPDMEPFSLRVEVQRARGQSREAHAQETADELEAALAALRAKGYR